MDSPSLACIFHDTRSEFLNSGGRQNVELGATSDRDARDSEGAHACNDLQDIRTNV